MLASTTSAASFSSSSLGSEERGERGRAMRPVRVDSRIPKGLISFRKESIREGLAETSTMQLLVLMSRTLPPN